MQLSGFRGTELRRVRVRGAQADPLQARQRLERALTAVDWIPPQLPPRAVPWNGVGLTHISFNVRNLPKWHDYLTRKGVECVSRPERSPRGHSFFFAKDFDGNLIELMDLGYMYHVLNWLGPLGGWIFRRGMYREYYQTPS